VINVSPPRKWKPEGRVFSVNSIGFYPCETRADIREFCRQIFGPIHIVLWIVDDWMGDFRYARVWHGTSLYYLQVDLIYGVSDLCGSERGLNRLYQRYQRKNTERNSPPQRRT